MSSRRILEIIHEWSIWKRVGLHPDTNTIKELEQEFAEELRKFIELNHPNIKEKDDGK